LQGKEFPTQRAWWRWFTGSIPLLWPPTVRTIGDMPIARQSEIGVVEDHAKPAALGGSGSGFRPSRDRS
jgi:hypothetical protein